MQDLVAIGFYFAMMFVAIIVRKKYYKLYFFIANIVAFCWIIIGQKGYEYVWEEMKIYGVSIFPFFAWSAGLFMINILCAYITEKVFKLENKIRDIAFTTVIYWILLISAEAIGYYLFDIKNSGTAMYAGLPICNCMHAPHWMQVTYFLMGPIYFILCSFVTTKTLKQLNGKSNIIN